MRRRGHRRCAFNLNMHCCPALGGQRGSRCHRGFRDTRIRGGTPASSMPQSASPLETSQVVFGQKPPLSRVQCLLIEQVLGKSGFSVTSSQWLLLQLAARSCAAISLSRLNTLFVGEPPRAIASIICMLKMIGHVSVTQIFDGPSG
jgi:hypothetical protein